MSSTLIQTCSLCGLRYTNSALLELHIREDHIQRNHEVAPDPGKPADSGTPQRGADGSSRRNASESPLPHPEKAATPRTTTPRPHRPNSGWTITVLRRAARTLWYVNDELLRASEAIIRSARAPQPGRRPAMPVGTDDKAGSDRTQRDQAA